MMRETRKLSTLKSNISDKLDIETFRSMISDDLDMVEKVFPKIIDNFAQSFIELEPQLGKIDDVRLLAAAMCLLEATNTGMLTVSLSTEEYKLVERILNDLIEEVESDMSRKEMTGGGTQRIIIRLLLIIAIAYAITMTLHNDFILRVGAYVRNPQCKTELSLVYSLIIHMMEQLNNTKEVLESIPVPQAAIDASLQGVVATKELVERIPVPQAIIDASLQGLAHVKGMLPPLHLFPYSFKNWSYYDIYKLFGWGSHKMAEQIGLVKSCTDNILIVREIVGKYSMGWRCYSLTAFVFYGFFFDGENRRKRSNFTEMLVQVIWRPFLGVGNPVIGTARGAVYALETLYDAGSAACDAVDRVFTPAPPKAMTWSEFEKPSGGKFTKRKNKIRKTKKY